MDETFADWPVIAIDLNVRTREGTYVGVEDVRQGGPVSAGIAVTVVEEESGIHGPAVVTAVDEAKQIIYLRLDWMDLR